MKLSEVIMFIIKKILPQIIFVLSAALIVLLIVNYYNPLMKFLDNNGAYAIMWALCVLSIIQSVILIYKSFKDKK